MTCNGIKIHKDCVDMNIDMILRGFGFITISQSNLLPKTYTLELENDTCECTISGSLFGLLEFHLCITSTSHDGCGVWEEYFGTLGEFCTYISTYVFSKDMMFQYNSDEYYNKDGYICNINGEVIIQGDYSIKDGVMKQKIFQGEEQFVTCKVTSETKLPEKCVWVTTKEQYDLL